MGKPILDRMKKPEFWYADQLPHWAIGLVVSAAISSPLAFTGTLPPALSIWIGITVALYAGWVRELIQNWGDAPSEGSVEDTNIDMMFWGLGALMGAVPAFWA